MDKGTKIGTATITLAEDKLGYLEDNNAPSTEIITDKTVEKQIFSLLAGDASQNFSVTCFN